jgi:hypothetical protein
MKQRGLREALRAWRKKRKKKTGTYLYDQKTGKMVLWIPCKSFARLVGRSYESILDLVRVRWLHGYRFGDDQASIFLVPKQKALQQFRELQRKGLIHS